MRGAGTDRNANAASAGLSAVECPRGMQWYLYQRTTTASTPLGARQLKAIWVARAAAGWQHEAGRVPHATTPVDKPLGSPE